MVIEPTCRELQKIMGPPNLKLGPLTISGHEKLMMPKHIIFSCSVPRRLRVNEFRKETHEYEGYAK